MQNATGQRVWRVMESSGGLAPYPPLRMVLGYLSADLRAQQYASTRRAEVAIRVQ
jgi:hypothetical protein